MENTIDLSHVPGVVTITNTGKTRRNVSISGINQQLPIEPGYTVKLMAHTSSELVGYLSQADGVLEVVLPDGD